jgi:hypothetical protein
LTWNCAGNPPSENFNIHNEIPNDQLIKLKTLQTAITESGLVKDNL